MRIPEVISKVVYTLQELEIKSTEENMRKLLGCIQVLKEISGKLDEFENTINKSIGGDTECTTSQGKTST